MSRCSRRDEGVFRSLTTRLIVWTLVAVGAVYMATVVVSNAPGPPDGDRRRRARGGERDRCRGEPRRGRAALDRGAHPGARGGALGPRPGRGGRRSAFSAASSRATRDVYGGAIAWTPGPRGEHRALYYHRGPDGSGRLEPADLASESYRYWERDWFREALASGKPLWTEPYRDTGGGEAWMVTFAVPFGAAGGVPAGVATADVRLQRLDSIVDGDRAGPPRLRPPGVPLGPRRRGVEGRPRRSRGHRPRSRPDPRRGRGSSRSRGRCGRGSRASRGSSGEGRPFRLTYPPVARAGWTLATLYPEDELLAGVSRLRVVQGLARAGWASPCWPSSWSSSPAGSRGRSRASRRARTRSPAATSTRRCRRSSRATRWGRSRARSTTCATR